MAASCAFAVQYMPICGTLCKIFRIESQPPSEGSHGKLEILAEIGHSGPMDHATDQSPPGWAELLDASLVEAARGELVPASEVHDAIRTALAELEREMAEQSGYRSG